MHSELHTRRLRLEPLHPRHDAELHTLCSNADVMRFSSLPPQTRGQSEALLTQWIAESAAGTCCSWILRNRQDGFVGQVSLFAIDRDNLRAELGYLLMPEHWGCGLASEAVGAAVRYAFGHLKLCRLEADVDPGNTGSWRALEKNGFRREGFLPKRWFKQGRFYDAFLYGLLNETRINELADTD